MKGKVLATWLQKLQDEFVNRMAAIDADAASTMDESEEESDIETVIEAAGGTGAGTNFQAEDGSTGQDGGGRLEDSEPSMDWSPEQRFEMTGALQSDTGEDN